MSNVEWDGKHNKKACENFKIQITKLLLFVNKQRLIIKGKKLEEKGNSIIETMFQNFKTRQIEEICCVKLLLTKIIKTKFTNKLTQYSKSSM